MSKEIDTNKLTIQAVFSWWYRIPSYQRPYVWNKDQITELLDDISTACEQDKESQYFLGSLVLQEKDNKDYKDFDVLDGQQRLTTLFLIMAVIRDLTQDAQLKEVCEKIVYQKENKFTKTPERLRIAFDIREDVKDFANAYLKSENGTQDKNIKNILHKKNASTSVVNMANAIGIITDYFKNKKNVNLDSFAEFLINNVILIYVSTKNLDDAFKLFTVLNNRGIKLRGADILKADNLSFIKDADENNKYAKDWELIENRFDEEFDEFLSHYAKHSCKR